VSSLPLNPRLDSSPAITSDGRDCDSDKELSDDEDPELLSLTEDAGGLRNLAVKGWAESRVDLRRITLFGDIWCGSEMFGDAP
jgi:hypothetical protein